MAKSYGEDLAYIHNVGHGGFAAESAPGLIEILSRSGTTDGRVVDLGCGSGLWAAELCRAGYEVVGIDFSAAMLAIARKRAPKARFHRGSFLSFQLPRSGAITSIGECLSYGFDTKAGKKELFRFFRRAYEALRSGGVFVFDLLTTRRAPSAEPRLGHRVGKDWAVLVRREYDANGTKLTRPITSFRKVGKLYRRTEEVHRLRLYRGSDVANELRRIGFRVRQLRGYGQQSFARGHTGFLARKP